jgi:hypothetical protein
MRNFRAIILVESVFFLIFYFGTSVSGALPLLDQPTIPGCSIRPGEVLEYKVKVRGITAGTQTLQVNGKKMLDGQEVYHVRSVSKARRFFSIFYRFSNLSESFILSEGLYPLHYTKQVKDGGYEGDIDVDFDLDRQTARITKDRKYTEIRVPLGIQDELSMIYLLRTKEIEVGEKYQFSVLTGTEIAETVVSVIRTEKLKTVLGTLDTIMVRTNPKNVTIWLTNDATRIPVRMEAPTKVGKLVSKLKAVD